MLRPIEPVDLPFLWAMLAEATAAGRAAPPVAEVQGQPVGRYLHGWGRPGDAGLVAAGDAGEALAAAWYRSFPAEDPGYGWVDDATPELAIATTVAARGQGLGGALVAGLLALAHAEGHAHLSLSVEVGNLRARSVYERLGFVSVMAPFADEDHLTLVAPTAPSPAV